MTTRRVASTISIHHLWDAIVSIKQQRQIPNMERITHYMCRNYQITPEEAEKQLECAVQDNLIKVKTVVGCKGSKIGIQQDSYRIPEEEMEDDGHDWYCYTCHKEGEVICCSTCHRVYHKDCLKEQPTDSEKLVCDTCKMIELKDVLKLEKDELNLLLSYVCLRLKENFIATPELLKVEHTEEGKWRYNLLIYEPLDLTIMGDKIDNTEYKYIEEFEADAQTVVHNTVLYYGAHSIIANMAEQMLEACCYDLREIQQCKECYRISNEKPNIFWFCQPCDPPHELVYAQLRGFPYWPAKVIRVNEGRYDVRFFGGKHERGITEKEHVKPITTSIKKLKINRTSGFNKAMQELEKHQQLLGQIPKGKKAKKRPRTPSAKTSHSNSKPRSKKVSVMSDDCNSESEVEEGNSSQNECLASSSSKLPRFRDTATPEDHNIVSSSCQESSSCAKRTVSTQTHKKLLASLISPKTRKSKEKDQTPCDCEQKYSKMFKEFKERLEAEKKEEKGRSLRELAERLRQDFEEEKKQAVTAAMERVEAELGEAKQDSEDQLRNAQHQRMEMSEVKKKQWCYNCEAEAIYHCCWNTSYCSVDCQQTHWQKEHKRTCRRK